MPEARRQLLHVRHVIQRGFHLDFQREPIASRLTTANRTHPEPITELNPDSGSKREGYGRFHVEMHPLNVYLVASSP